MTASASTTTANTSRQGYGLFLAFVGVAIFGGTLPATRIALDAFDPYFITAGRAALAGICSLALLFVLRRPFPTRDKWKWLFLASFGVVLGFPLFMALGMQTVPVAHGGVVLGAMPLAAALAGVILTAERPNRTYWFAAVAGAALVIIFTLRQNLRHGGVEVMLGDVYLVAAMVLGSIGYVYSGKLTRFMPGWEVISWALVVALPFTLVVTLLTLPPNLAEAPMRPWLGFLYVAFFSQWISFFPWNAAIAICGITRASQVQLLQTFVTLGLAALINHEHLDLETVLFAVAVVATVAISTRTKMSAAPVAQGG